MKMNKINKKFYVASVVKETRSPTVRNIITKINSPILRELERFIYKSILIDPNRNNLWDIENLIIYWDRMLNPNNHK